MANPKSPTPAEDEEEDDYLNFTFDQPSSQKKESSLQRTARLKKESLERGRILPKAERDRLATLAREKALSTALPTTASKGAAMMAKMGHKPGTALGATGNEGRVNPVEVQIKEGKGGIGVDSEKKRKIREMAEAEEEGVKRVKLSAEEYREREGREREERRVEGMWWGGMKVLEGFEEDGEKGEGGQGGNGGEKKRVKDINILYRPLIASRRNAETERLTRSRLLDSLAQPSSLRTADLTSTLATSDSDDDLGNEVEDDNEDIEDPELEAYEAQPASEKLERVVRHLRKEWRYCFWCKFRYPDEEMEGCPGEDEDSHG